MHRLELLVFLAALQGCTISADTDDVVLAETNNATALGSLEITAPASGILVSSEVTIDVVVDGDVDSIALYADGTKIGEPVDGQYVWDVRDEMDRTSSVVARGLSEGRAVESLPVSIQIDTTAPSAETLTPDRRAAEVDLRLPIIVEFNEPLDPANVADAVVALERSPLEKPSVTPGMKVPVEWALSDDAMTITIEPQVGVFGLATFDVQISGFQDVAGNEMEPLNWSWEAAGWVEAAPLLDDFSRPDIAFAGGELFIHGERNGQFIVQQLDRARREWSTKATNVVRIEEPAAVVSFLVATSKQAAWAIFSTPTQFELHRYNLTDGTSLLDSVYPQPWRPSIAYGSDGSFYRAFYDLSSNDGVKLDRLVAGQWEWLEPHAFGSPMHAHMVVDDRVKLVTLDESAEIAYWEAMDLQTIPIDWNIRGLAVASDGKRAMMDSTGRRIITVERTGAESRLYVRGSASGWQLLGDYLNRDPRFNVPRVADATTPEGLWIAWEEYDSTFAAGRVHVKRWGGPEWIQQTSFNGVVNDPDVYTTHPSLTVTAGGVPYLAFSGGTRSFVMQPNSTF